MTDTAGHRAERGAVRDYARGWDAALPRPDETPRRSRLGLCGVLSADFALIFFSSILENQSAIV